MPRWWLDLWALLGTRNESQRGKPWREVLDLNAGYCQSGLNYRSMRFYGGFAHAVFGNYEELADLHIEEAGGGAAKILRRLPRFVSRQLAHLHTMLIAMQKL